MALVESSRQVALQSALGRIQSRWGDQALERAVAGGERRSGAGAPPAAFATGIRHLDHLTGVGGFPLGRVSICLGLPGSGKMLAGYRFLAQASRDCAVVLLLDLRGHADPWTLASLGARTDRVLVLRPDGPGRAALTQGLEATLALVRAGVGAVLADLPPKVGESRLWDPYAAALAAACARESTPLVLVAESIAEPLRHASSLTLWLRREEWLLRHGEIEGMRVRATMEKNKLAGVGHAVEFELRYPRGTFIAPPPIAAASAVIDEVDDVIERPAITLAS